MAAVQAVLALEAALEPDPEAGKVALEAALEQAPEVGKVAPEAAPVADRVVAAV